MIEFLAYLGIITLVVLAFLGLAKLLFDNEKDTRDEEDGGL